MFAISVSADCVKDRRTLGSNPMLQSFVDCPGGFLGMTIADSRRASW
jgi:hypothetical protein